MGFLDGYKIKKAVAVLLASQNPASPQTVQAISRLKEIGRPALVQLVDVLGNARHPEIIEELLAAFLDNDTFAFFMSHLTHPNAQVASSVARVFVKSTKYGFLSPFGDSRKRHSSGTQRHAIGSGHTLLCGDSPTPA